MSIPTKKDSAPAGLTTGALAVAALAVVLVCACAALLVGTSGGLEAPVPQASASPTPQAAVARTEGRLDKGQEWALIALIVLLPASALWLFYRLVKQKPAQNAVTRSAIGWPKFKALSAVDRKDKAKAEVEIVKQVFTSEAAGAPAAAAAAITNLEKNTLDAKSLAVQQLFFERDDWLLGPVSLEKDNLETAFDAVLARGEEIFPVDVRYLPKACAEAAADKDELMTVWQQRTRDRVSKLVAKLSEDGVQLMISDRKS